MAAKLMSNTPTIASNYQESVESYRQLILSTGEDLQRPGLEETPMRAAKAFAHLTQGYHQSLDESSTTPVSIEQSRAGIGTEY